MALDSQRTPQPDRPGDLTPEGSRLAKLELNARIYKPDPTLDAAADLLDAGDLTAFGALHPILQDRASLHHDFRKQYRRAVQAGAIPDDRGPTAA